MRSADPTQRALQRLADGLPLEARSARSWRPDKAWKLAEAEKIGRRRWAEAEGQRTLAAIGRPIRLAEWLDALSTI